MLMVGTVDMFGFGIRDFLDAMNRLSAFDQSHHSHFFKPRCSCRLCDLRSQPSMSDLLSRVDDIDNYRTLSVTARTD